MRDKNNTWNKNLIYEFALKTWQKVIILIKYHMQLVSSAALKPIHMKVNSHE